MEVPPLLRAPEARTAAGSPVPSGEPFKQCNLCGMVWPSYRDFVTDLQLRLEGYQASFDDPELGWILVTHMVEGCHTTLAVRAGELRVLRDGPEIAEYRTGLEDCIRLCLDRGRLEDCTAPCAMAWVRHVLQWLRRHELPPHLDREPEPA